MRVRPDQDGERLDALLAEQLGSRTRAQRLIEEGRVTVDGEVRPKRHRVTPGELIEVDEPPRPEPPRRVVVPFDVVHEDEHLLVVDKPAGVVVHPARGHRSGTLAQALEGKAAGGEDAWRAGIVHRLDRDTSGLIVVAKSDEAHRRLKAMIQRRDVTREYVALVLGRPPSRSGTIDAPIGRDRRHRTRISIDTDEPREAVTHFAILRALPDATLLVVRLETGRTHQIRAHMQAIGHPVAGDPEYGGEGAFGLGRQFLHASRLAFTHPFDETPLDLTSPLPGDLAAALHKAGG